MCQTCGYSICQCPTTYNYNWYNTDGLPCTTCSGAIVCAKKVPAKCTMYNGTNLDAIDLTTNTDVETIIAALNTAILNLQLQYGQQLAINADLTARIVALEA